METSFGCIMRYWWVNQNQTYRAEFAGGYLWSPKRNRNGARNQFYENMRGVAPGDLIFSYRDTKLVALGWASSNCYDAPKPEEFGTTGENWELNGWKVDLAYMEIDTPIRPRDYITLIRPLLPTKYSPLQDSGDGLQSVYLAELPSELASLLLNLLREAGNIIHLDNPHAHTESHRDEVIDQVEREAERSIGLDEEIASTEKEQIVKARCGQGRFREDVQRFENGCRLSGITDSQFLIASHIKPWRAATNAERLDGQNGLMLSPNIDFLFDRGFISFHDDGTLLISSAADTQCLSRLGVPVDRPTNVGSFTQKQQVYLAYHRRNIFLEVGRER